MSNLQVLRQRFSEQGLGREEVSADPFQQFGRWFDQTLESDTAEPNGMTLSTVSESGRPSQRTVLMKSWDENGFVFYTNHTSRKGQQMLNNQSVSVLFPWLALHRQIIIEGQVSRISDERSLAYFHSRPRGSQIGAWASRQSTALDSRQELENRIAEVESRFLGQEIPLPPFWGGYCIKPDFFEFWQGRNHRIHDRIAYQRDTNDSHWTILRLSP